MELTSVQSSPTLNAPIARPEPQQMPKLGIESESAFAKSIKQSLTPDAQGNIHEEELQHGIVVHMLESVGPQAKERYLWAFDRAIGSGTPPLSAEDAVKVALRDTVQSGLLSQADAERINGVSFAAAQLDNNLTALYDNRGGPEDRTIAVMQIDQAIAKAEGALQAIETGKTSLQMRPLDAPSNLAPSQIGLSSGGGGSGAGFLWKPISESDGKLVVLLPSSLTGQVDSAGIYSSLPSNSETLIEQGRFTGDNKNGGRAHFRFSRPGASYPDGAYVVAQLENGSSKIWRINDSAARNT